MRHKKTSACVAVVILLSAACFHSWRERHECPGDKATVLTRFTLPGEITPQREEDKDTVPVPIIPVALDIPPKRAVTSPPERRPINAPDTLKEKPMKKRHTIRIRQPWGDISGGGPYPEDSVATLRAFPKPGYRFAGWFQGESLLSTDTTFHLKAHQDENLTASFVPEEHDITCIAQGGGSVSGGGAFPHGSVATLRAIPLPGHDLTGWFEAGIKVGSGDILELTANRPRSIEARFSDRRLRVLCTKALRHPAMFRSDGIDRGGTLLRVSKILRADGLALIGIETSNFSRDTIPTPTPSFHHGRPVLGGPHVTVAILPIFTYGDLPTLAGKGYREAIYVFELTDLPPREDITIELDVIRYTLKEKTINKIKDL